jgi:ADP-ribose pyrophosphatase YjhB (NUDIX family)
MMKCNFCPVCGHAVKKFRKDNHDRYYCPECDKTIYINPTVGVAVVLVKDRRILLAKRLGTYEGMWCIPCGHVEWGEDVRESAKREFQEETGIEVVIGSVVDVHSNFHDPDHLTVGIWFMGTQAGGRLLPGSDASEVQFFSLDQLPADMAFPTDILICDKLKRLGLTDTFDTPEKT